MCVLLLEQGSPVGVGISDLPVTPKMNGEIGCAATILLAGIDCSTKCGKHNKSYAMGQMDVTNLSNRKTYDWE